MSASELVRAGFMTFRVINKQRTEESFHPIDVWSECDWITAALGELGEAANLIKKRRRGELINAEQVAAELADTITYIDLLATRMGIDLGDALIKKFDQVSSRIGSCVFLGPSDSSASSVTT